MRYRADRNGRRTGFVARCCGALLLLLLLPFAVAAGERSVRVGVYDNSPKIAIGKDGRPEGIFIDLLEAIAKREGWRLEYVAGTWNEGLERLASGAIDVMPDVALTPEREQIYTFHEEPVLSSWNQVYARPGSGIRTLLDLGGRRVAVLDGSVQQDMFRQMMQSYSVYVELVPFPDFPAAFAAVTAGRADAVVSNRFFGGRHARRYGLEDTAIIFHPSRFFFVTLKGKNSDLLFAIDRHLREYKNDARSPYFRSLQKWSLEPEKALLPPWAPVAATAALLLLAASGAWVITLRRRVAGKTRELEQRQRETESINHILRRIAMQLDLGKLLDEAAKNAADLGGFAGGRLYVCDAETALPLPEADVGTEYPAVLEFLATEKAHAVIASIGGNNKGCTESGWLALFRLHLQSRPIGVLCLNTPGSAPPPAHALALVSDICGPIALALENARLHALAQQHAATQEQRVADRTREIAELSTFLQAIIDHISSPIFYKGPDLRFRGCNEAYERAFGINRLEFIGRTVLDLEYLPLADREAYQAEDAAVLAAGSTLCREAAIPFADGEVHQTMYSVAGFRGPFEQPAGLVGIIVDVTPLKRAEAELRVAKVAAESADRLKSAFLATMSHELRTPLNSIIGFTGIVLQGLAGPLTGEQERQLGMVRDSARHLLALINDVLDISKIEAGELKVADEPFELASSLDKVANLVRPLAEKKGLSLALEGREIAPSSMHGDARRVEQILLNLLSNAIKFTDAGGVRVVVETADDAGQCVSRAIRIKVIDSGVGIRADDLAQLFQPFRQVDSALARRHEGTGLGLTICRRLASLMGGSVEVESRWGEGSIFSLTLPVRSTAEYTETCA